MEQNKLQHFTIVQDLSNDHINQLIRYSKEDPDILQFTRDAHRFTDYEVTKQFLGEADVYALVDNETLVGIIWFSVKSLPKKEFTKIFDQDAYDTTFAIRLYGQAKGKGLSFAFMDEAFNNFFQKKGKRHIWLQTRAENIRAIHLYEKFGFKQVSVPDDAKRIIMIQF